MDVDCIDINQFARSLQKARNYAVNFKYKCCCRDCSKEAIKSHLLQRHPILVSIADENNKVLQFEDNWEDARSGRWDLYSEKLRGINDAFQYRLFCGEHDSALFKELERNNSIPSSKRDCLLLAYRAACSVRHQEERRMQFYEYRLQCNSNEIDAAWLSNSKAFVRRMDAVIENLLRALDGEDESYMFRMIAMPYVQVAASDCIVDEDNYQAHIMDDEYREPLNCCFVNLIPVNDRLLLLLGCDTRHDRNGKYKSIVSEFPANCDLPYQQFVETIWGILLKCHNWCCSPKLLEDPQWKDFFENYEALKVNSIAKH